MAAPDPFAAHPFEKYAVEDWRETAKTFRASGENSFSRRGAECAVEAVVPSAKLAAALRMFLGYDFVTASNPFRLQRTNPVRHPRYPNLYCTAASEVEFAPSGKDDGTPGKIAGKAKRERTGTGFSLAYPGNELRYWTNYKKARVLLRFQPLPYEVREDDYVVPGLGEISNTNAEYERNFWTDTEARTEVLSVETPFAFAEGESLPAGYTSPKGKTFKGEIAQAVVKPDVVMHWAQVPQKYLFRTDERIPRRLVRMLGTLNDDAFQGFVRGTLLATGFKLTRYTYPLAASTEDLFYYDVDVYCSYFDPRKGRTGAGAAQITTNRGHGNAPWQGLTVLPIVGVPVDDGNSGMWFYVSRTGAVSADGHDAVYRYSNYPDAFKHVSNADPAGVWPP